MAPQPKGPPKVETVHSVGRTSPRSLGLWSVLGCTCRSPTSTPARTGRETGDISSACIRNGVGFLLPDFRVPSAGAQGRAARRCAVLRLRSTHPAERRTVMTKSRWRSRLSPAAQEMAASSSGWSLSAGLRNAGITHSRCSVHQRSSASIASAESCSSSGSSVGGGTAGRRRLAVRGSASALRVVLVTPLRSRARDDIVCVCEGTARAVATAQGSDLTVIVWSSTRATTHTADAEPGWRAAAHVVHDERRGQRACGDGGGAGHRGIR